MAKEIDLDEVHKRKRKLTPTTPLAVAIIGYTARLH
jgi:hypothetical protein